MERMIRYLRPASLVALAAATLATFWGVLRNGWIGFDDPDYIVANSHINQGLTRAGLRWIMHQPHGGNFHPLTSVLHMLSAQAFGLNPVGHHAVSLALHTLNAVLLAVALARLTRAWWKSVLVAALFALHPLRVESVAWVSELKDVLSGLFFMLTLLAYARWAERPGAGRHAVVAACLAVGLMAKPMLVTVPCVLVLLDIWPIGRLQGLRVPGGAPAPPWRAPVRSLGGLIAEKWPLFALAAASSVTTFLVQRGSGAVVAAANMPLPARVVNAGISYWRYLGLTFWPHGLLPFYGMTGIVNVPLGALSVLGLVAVTALTIRRASSRPYLPVGWLWYVGTLVPVIGLIQVGMQAYADRYTYLPVIGIAVAVVWGLDDVLPRARPIRNAALAAACAALVALGVATARQTALWRSNRILFTHTLAVDPHNLMGHHCLGTELLNSGHPREALEHFDAVLGAHIEYAPTRANRAVALSALGRNEEAIADFSTAIEFGDGAVVRHNFGLTLGKLGRYDEAITQYQAALRFDPDHYPTLVELGAALGTVGRFSEAEATLRRAIEMRPDEARVRRLLAVNLTRLGRVEEAIDQYSELLRRDPNDLDALNNIAWIRATHADPRHRDGSQAVRLAERAVAGSREPMAVLYSTLAASYAEAGRFQDAVRAGARAVELARSERDSLAGARYAEQLACYRSGRPFHFAR
jgi:tetratricopeptide (TPR) repeat protein